MKVSAPPPSNAAAHTATAVPSSSSRPCASTPPAPQPTTWAGSSASCTPSSVASGRGEMGARGEHDGEVGRGSPQAPARARSPPRLRRSERRARSTRPRRCGRACDGRYSARDGASASALYRPVRPDRCGQDRGRAGARRRLRAAGEEPVAVSADALQVYRGLEVLTGAPTPAERARLEHRLVVVPARGRAGSRAGEYAELVHAEIDGAARRRPAPDRRRRHRAVPARRAGRPRSAPAPAARRARALRRPSSPQRGAPRAARPRWRSARRGPRRRSSATTGSASCARWSCSTPARWTRRRATTSCGRATRGIRRSSSGLTMEREELFARLDARVDAMVAAGARDEVLRAACRRRVGDRAQGAGLRGAVDGRRRGDEAPNAQSGQAPAHLDAQAGGRRTSIDATGRRRGRRRGRGGAARLYDSRGRDARLREVAGPRERLRDRRGRQPAVRADTGARRAPV